MTFHHYYRFRRNNPYEDTHMHIVIVGEVVCASDYSLSIHHHRGIEFCLVVKGRGHFHTEGNTHIVEPGQIFLSVPGQSHWAGTDPADPHQMFYLGFECGKESRLRAVYEQMARVEDPIRKDSCGMEQVFRLLMKEYVFPAESGEVLIESLYTQLIMLLHRNYHADIREIEQNLSSSQRLLSAAITFIESNWNRPVSLEQMGDILGYSSDHIGRIFRRHMNMTVSRYLNELRLEKAAILLSENPRTTITEIAQKTGYSDVHYFGRKFKEYFGETPGTHRVRGGPEITHRRPDKSIDSTPFEAID
jgi:AraC-like DNA-binding protein/quercetin dioxygenase-like cupin family protein